MTESISDTERSEVLWIVEAKLAAGQGIVMEQILTAHEQPYALWEHRETGEGTTRLYCETENEAEELERLLQDWLKSWSGGTLDPMPPTCRRTLLREDWSESWKKYFSTARVSEHIVIKPSWETFQPAQDDIVLEIDPGMSFGTGQHGTTRACLQFMDELRSKTGPVSFLDAGCGSGILSLAAWKLGFHPIYAFDNDPTAVSVAREHLVPARAENVSVACSEIQNYKPPHNCRIVAANILAVVLLERAESIVSFLDSGKQPSHLILSGILEHQYPEVKRAFTALGLEERDTRLIDEWKSGAFVLR